MERLDDKTLRKLQLAELDILNETVRICEKYNLSYYITGATLLGAIKMKGFIPWDDDIDICMPANDYRKLVEVSTSEFPDNMFMETQDTDDAHIESFGKVRLINSTIIQEGYNPYGRHNGIWIDIFPMVYTQSKEEWRHKISRLKVSYCCNSKEYAKANPELFKKNFGGFVYVLFKLFLMTPGSFKRWIRRRMTEPIFNAKEGPYMALAYPWSDKLISTEEYLAGHSYVEFEGRKYRAPVDIDRYLKMVYGDYWSTPPEDKRRVHKVEMLDFEHSYKEIKHNMR